MEIAGAGLAVVCEFFGLFIVSVSLSLVSGIESCCHAEYLLSGWQTCNLSLVEVKLDPIAIVVAA